VANAVVNVIWQTVHHSATLASAKSERATLDTGIATSVLLTAVRLLSIRMSITAVHAATPSNSRSVCMSRVCRFECNSRFAGCDKNTANRCEATSRTDSTNCGHYGNVVSHLVV
jgi:hypothetical protein